MILCCSKLRVWPKTALEKYECGPGPGSLSAVGVWTQPLVMPVQEEASQVVLHVTALICCGMVE